MPTIVQKIDFVLGLNQVIELIKDKKTNGIKITLAVTSDAQIILFTEGVIWDGVQMKVLSPNPQTPCPVPPDCPTNLDCVTKLNSLMPLDINTESLLTFL